MRPTWTSPGRVEGPAWPCTWRGLPCAPTSPRRRCALTAPFHPCLCAPHVRARHRRSVLCGTFPRVSPGGRYPPPCPVVSGLSSKTPFGDLRDYLARTTEGTPRRPLRGAVPPSLRGVDFASGERGAAGGTATALQLSVTHR